MCADILEIVTDPSKHSPAKGGVNVAHKAVQSTITFGIPACGKARKVTYRAQEVKPGASRRVKDLHEYFRRDRC